MHFRSWCCFFFRHGNHPFLISLLIKSCPPQSTCSVVLYQIAFFKMWDIFNLPNCSTLSLLFLYNIPLVLIKSAGKCCSFISKLYKYRLVSTVKNGKKIFKKLWWKCVWYSRVKMDPLVWRETKTVNLPIMSVGLLVSLSVTIFKKRRKVTISSLLSEHLFSNCCTARQKNIARQETKQVLISGTPKCLALKKKGTHFGHHLCLCSS